MSEALIALVAALSGAVATFWISERRLRLANVTAERAAWRERIRALSGDLLVEIPEEVDQVARNLRERAAIGLQLSTNPFDQLDREIVELAYRVAGSEERKPDDVRLLALRLQLLLKHDWERAKLEARWSGALSSFLRRLTGQKVRPARPNYTRLVDWRARNVVEIDSRHAPF